MISRQHRFRGYSSLKYVYKNGTIVRGPLFAVKAIENPKRGSYRLAVVVSRKVNKSAVARNRIRRRLYEAVRQLEADILRPYDIVLTVFHSSVLEEPAQSLAAQVKKQLSEAGVLAKRVR
ncbi:MAG TPA: ribonuclease P protein component [Candidatus Saccharimonadales bacterium]|nr:ribonuclease P protein component [Candidatus Saccharimonadales bacterium]